MASQNQLVNALRNGLKKHGYTEFYKGLIKNVQFMAIMKTPRQGMVSYICAVVYVPNSVSDVHMMRKFFNKIRRSLTSQYAKLPLLKELGTFLVLFCNHKLYENLQGKEWRFKDITGIHINVILGTCFIDKQTLTTSASSTWGLFYSGKHFKTICTILKQWCKAKS